MEKNSSNIFILFAPGLGGHHVANMLSTDKRFMQRATLSDYENHLKKRSDAHIKIDVNNDLMLSNDQNKVLLLHFGTLIWDYEKVKKFKNRKILIIEFPKNKNTLAFKRFADYNKNFYLNNKYMFQEQRLLYSQCIIEKLVSEKDFFNIESEKIFDDNFDFIYDFVLNTMNLNIDYNLCKNMHDKWINTIKKSI